MDAMQCVACDKDLNGVDERVNINFGVLARKTANTKEYFALEYIDRKVDALCMSFASVLVTYSGASAGAYAEAEFENREASQSDIYFCSLDCMKAWCIDLISKLEGAIAENRTGRIIHHLQEGIGSRTGGTTEETS